MELHTILPHTGSRVKNKRSRNTLWRSIAIITALTFIQNVVATVEIIKIAQLKALEAALWGALNASCYIIGIVTIVIEPKRKLIIPFYILAALLATYLGTLLGKYWS
jgi:hypothetical protein